MDILISEDVVGPAIDALRARFDVFQDETLHGRPEALREKLAAARAWIVRNRSLVTEAMLAAAPRLLVVGRAGAGLDNVDVAACSRHGVVVAYTPEENAVSVAEMTLALVLALAKRLIPADRHVRQGGWDRRRFWGTELAGKTLGLLGLGRIGCRVALRARAFGMRVLAYDPFVSPHSLGVTESGAQLVELDALLEQSDFVSCHLPSTPSTRGLLHAERLCRLKPTACFINTSRGDVVVEADLARLLAEGRLAGAGLDVRAEEPPPPDSPLHGLDNVILMPHVAGLTHEAQEKITRSIAADVARVLEGRPAVSFANFARPCRPNAPATDQPAGGTPSSNRHTLSQ